MQNQLPSTTGNGVFTMPLPPALASTPLDLSQAKAAVVIYFDKDMTESDEAGYAFNGKHRECWLVGLSKNKRNSVLEMRALAEKALLNIPLGAENEPLLFALSRLSTNSFSYLLTDSRGVFLADRASGSRWIIEKWCIDSHQHIDDLTDALNAGRSLVLTPKNKQ